MLTDDSWNQPTTESNSPSRIAFSRPDYELRDRKTVFPAFYKNYKQPADFGHIEYQHTYRKRERKEQNFTINSPLPMCAFVLGVFAM